MIKFKLKDRDEKTGVRTGIFKSNQNTFSTPERTLVSTELNYQNSVKDIVKDLDFPNEAFVAQLKVDAKSLWTRDNDYYNSLIRQAQRYTSQIVKKICILKVHLYVPRRERQADGRYKRKEIPLRNRSVDLSDEQRQRIIRSIISLGIARLGREIQLKLSPLEHSKEAINNIMFYFDNPDKIEEKDCNWIA